MPSGIASGAWGYSPQMVGNMNNSIEYMDRPITYQESLTSTPLENNMKSPLTEINKSLYTHHFGKKKKKSSEYTYLLKFI